VFWSIVAAIFLLATALSLRRTMWVTLAVGAAASLALHAHRGLARVLLRAGVVAVVGLCASLAILWAMGVLGQLTTHMQSLVMTLAGRGEEASISSRLFETADVVRAIRVHPFIGAGPAGQYVASGGYAHVLARTHAHHQ